MSRTDVHHDLAVRGPRRDLVVAGACDDAVERVEVLLVLRHGGGDDATTYGGTAPRAWEVAAW